MAMFDKEVAEREPYPGVVTGLAYSGSGNGGILFVESTKMPGKGELQLTGKSKTTFSSHNNNTDFYIYIYIRLSW